MSAELDAAVAAIQSNTAALIGRLDEIAQQLTAAAAANDSASVQAAVETLNKVVADEKAALNRDTLPTSGGGAGAGAGSGLGSGSGSAAPSA